MATLNPHSFGIRLATMEDAVDLLRFKNEADTRKNSIVSHDEIKMENHLVWLKQHIQDPDCELYVITNNGTPIGDVRFDHLGAEIEISIRMDKAYRGFGMATSIVGFAGSIMQANTGKTLVAKIVEGNVASMRVFIANGYRPEVYEKGETSYYIFKKLAH